MTNNHSIINQYFDHVYVLNLEKRPDRKIAMIQKLNRLGIKAEFVNAINGYSTQNIKEHQHYLEQPISRKGGHELEIKFQRKLIKSPGGWGCLKTFFSILNDAKNKEYQRILCFEDDVIFHKDFENKMKKVINDIPEDWKLIYLGASQYVWNIPHGLSYPDKNKKTIDKNEPFYFPKNTDGTFAIGIHASVIDLIQEEILKMNCPFDSGPIRSVIKIHPKKCFVINPNIVIADVSDSDIRIGQDQEELAELLKWNLEDYILKEEQALVSVIMPAYNAGKTISKALHSILLQSYSNLDIIVVNDASTDDTEAIVRELIEKDARIRLVTLEKNSGVGGARNAGIKIANGQFIAFQDADDVSLRHRIAKQLVPIYTEDVLFSTSRIYRSRCKMEELDITDQQAMMTLVKSRRKLNRRGEYDYIDHANVGLVTIVYKKEVFETYGLFDEHRFGEDLEYVERILYALLKPDFHEKFNGHSYLNSHTNVPKIYQTVDEALLVCSDMDEQNLSVQFESKKSESLLIEKKFRQKYRLEDFKLYPKFQSDKPLKNDSPPHLYNTLTVDSFVLLPEIEHQTLLTEIRALKKEKGLKAELIEIYRSVRRIIMLLLGKFNGK